MELPFKALLEMPSAVLLAFPPDASVAEPCALLFVIALPLVVPAEVPDVLGRAGYWTLPLLGGLDELMVGKVEGVNGGGFVR